jgi:hypothetical protein
LVPDDDASVEPRVEIRQPRALRVYIVVFGCIWCAGVIAGIGVTAAALSPTVFIPLAMLAFAAFFFSRIYRISVVSEGDELVVRNWFTTRRLRRADIEDFRIGSAGPSYPFGKSIYAMLNDGTVLSLDVLARPAFTARSRDRLARALAELKGWLGAGSAPWPRGPFG